MTLAAGSTLGHYEVVSSLGAGGMGEVYRAEDKNLGRQVAIKLLLDDVSGDPDRLARFEREARVLASLNHANVATLHGFEKDGDTRFLVMELVEGETLEERIGRGALSTGETLDLFIQIAQGLAAAHEKGVIHRDLKPANIKIDETGCVKILDFGLARAMTPEADESDVALSMSPTLTLAATQRGEILGTAAYMSPEQAKGKVVDRRTDIWAFGACLFEALSGQRSFRGNDASELLAAVLALEPDWDQLPADLPPALRRLVERCLRKDPARRLHDISDVRLELEEIDPAAAVPQEGVAHGRLAGPLTWAAVAFGIVSSVALAWTLWTRPSVDESLGLRPSLHTVLDTQTEERLGNPGNKLFDISRDGRSLVFVGLDADRGLVTGVLRLPGEDRGEHLYLRDLGTSDVRLLPGTQNAQFPVFSFDGSQVAFARTSTLWTLSLTGGAPRQVHEFDGLIFSLTWTSDDRLVVVIGDRGSTDRLATRDTRLVWVPADGGTPQPFGSGEVEGTLPGLRSIAGGDVTLTVSDDDGSELLRLSPDGTVARVALPAGAQSASLLPSGHLVWTSRRGSGEEWDVQVLAAPFDRDRFEIAGTATAVLDGMDGTATGYSSYAFSDQGLLVYRSGGRGQFGIFRIATVSPAGTVEALVPEWRRFHYPRISPDGRSIAVTIHGEGEPHELFLYDVGRGAPTPLTSRGDNIMSVWHPSGESFAYAKATTGYRDYDLYSRRLDEEGEGEVLLQRPGAQLPWAWSPDGTALVFGEDGDETDADLWLLPLGEEPRPLVTGAGIQTSASISPDGEWMIYESDEADGTHIYVRSFPGPAQSRRVSETAAVEPLWSPDGSSIYYRHAGFESLHRVSFEASPGGLPRLGREEVVTMGSWGNYALGGPSYSIAPDGRIVVLEPKVVEEDARRLRTIVNWFDELERRVPTR